MPFGLPDTGFDRVLSSGSVRKSRAARNFFDRAAVIGMMNKKTHKVLSRFGYFVMRDARQSIRRRKSSARPGQSPTNWTGILKRNIFFDYDSYRRSVVIGPWKLPGKVEGIPKALEHGGIVYSEKARGPVRIQPRPYMEPAFQRQLKKQMPDLWAFY